MAAPTPASTPSAAPSSGSTSGATGAGGGGGVAPTSASSSAIASPARNGATQAPTQRSHGQHVHVLAARAGERVDGRHQRRQQQRDRQQREHPARHHLADRGHVAVRAVLGRGPRSSAVTVLQRGAPERAQLVLVDRLDRPVAARRQLAASRRSGPRRSRGPAAPPAARCRSGTRAARAGRSCPRAARQRVELARGSTPRPFAAGRSPRAARSSTTPGERAAPASARPGRRWPAPPSTSSGAGQLVEQLASAPTSPSVDAVERGQHERLARGAALEHARQLDQRGGVGRAAGCVRDRRGVAVGDDHDLAARAAGAAADHVHEPLARRG